MSRTHHHGDKAKARLHGPDNWVYRLRKDVTPKWYRKMHKHRPRRAAVRRCKIAVKKGDQRAMQLPDFSISSADTGLLNK